MEIELERYEELIEAETRLGILRRMINDEDAEATKSGLNGSLWTRQLRQVLGMASWEAK